MNEVKNHKPVLVGVPLNHLLTSVSVAQEP
jgi:hypothetical protein